MQKSLGPRAWSSLWQQNPRIIGGNLIDRRNFTSKTDPNHNRILPADAFDEHTKGLTWVRAWDFAYTTSEWSKADPDWTVGALMAFKINYDIGEFDIFLKDIVRFRTKWGESKQRIAQVAKDDGADCFIGGEGNGPQSAALQDLHGMPSLSLHTFVPLPTSYYGADLKSRAQLWASRAQVGKMWLREASWNSIFFDEAEGFPSAAHDDIVSAVSIAYVLASMVVNGVQPEVEQQQINFTTRW
jgi:phage terminase large subunit-like protein